MKEVDATTKGLDRRTLLALIDASRAINQELDPAEVCRHVAEHAVTVLRAEGSSVLLYDEGRGELEFQTVVGPESTAVVHKRRFSAELGIAGQVVRTGRAVRVDDVTTNRNFYAGIDDLTHLRTRNLIAAPLVHGEKVFGVVEVINRDGGGAFADADLELLQVLANLVAGTAWNARAFERLDREARALREVRPSLSFVGESDAFVTALRLCEKVAPATTTVLLQGETGTGKEMAAQAIHALSPRAERPFVPVNCAALPESLIESEMFGHEKGAFTGATDRAAGRFELAHGGTLFLDEIGELKLEMQSKLLRALETQEVTRVGGAEPITCDVRVIAATNRDLKAAVEAGSFRDDLFYRLSVFPIELPALRDRLDDLPLLVEHLLARVAPSVATELPSIDDAALACLRHYAWPGNVRELRNVVERATLLADGHIQVAHLPDEIRRAAAGPPDGADAPARSALAEAERDLILGALSETNWNQSAAARKLGITRDILRYRIKRYSIARPDA